MAGEITSNNENFFFIDSGTGDQTGSILSRLKRRYLQYRNQKRLIDQVVGVVDPRLKQAARYRKRLSGPIHTCRQHCRSIVESIPGPIRLQPPDYNNDPIIKAAFAESGELTKLLKKSELALSAEDSAGPERVALLSMMHEFKETFGHRQHGAMLLGQERLTAVTFSNHKIVGLAGTVEQSRRKLELVVFNLIIEAASHELAVMNADVAELRERKEKLEAMWRIFGGPRTTSAGGSWQSSGNLEKLDKVEALLEETELDLEEALHTVESPRDRLVYLERYLAEPHKIFNIAPLQMRLDWRNVISENTDTAAHKLTLVQCTLGKVMARDAVFIAYPAPLSTLG